MLGENSWENSFCIGRPRSVEFHARYGSQMESLTRRVACRLIQPKSERCILHLSLPRLAAGASPTMYDVYMTTERRNEPIGLLACFHHLWMLH